MLMELGKLIERILNSRRKVFTIIRSKEGGHTEMVTGSR
jgi:hypothetical protein